MRGSGGGGVLRDLDDFGGLGGGGRIGREIRRREQGGDWKEEVGLDGIHRSEIL